MLVLPHAAMELSSDTGFDLHGAELKHIYLGAGGGASRRCEMAADQENLEITRFKQTFLNCGDDKSEPSLCQFALEFSGGIV
jgi:hypothetical protein